MEVYSGQVCADLLTSLQACYSGVSSPPPPLNIPTSNINQQEREINAALFLNSLPFFNPSANCLERIQSFICLHIFGLCDTSGDLHVTTREECLSLRDSVCSDVWMTILSVSQQPGTLPVCEDLPYEMEECIVGMLALV